MENVCKGIPEAPLSVLEDSQDRSGVEDALKAMLRGGRHAAGFVRLLLM